MKMSVQTCPEAVQSPFFSCPELSKGLSNDVLESVQGHNRTTRATRIEEKETPFRGCEIIATSVVCIAAVGTTLAGFDLWVQISFYLFSLALVIGFDPLFLFGRVLAPQSKLLFAIDFIIASIATTWDRKEMYIVTLIYTVIVLLLVSMLNREWLDNFNFQMSPAVQQILNNSPDSKAFEAWSYFGKKDSITLARYQGNGAQEHIVNGLYRPFWLLGFNSAYKTVTATVNRAEKAERSAEDYKTKYEESERERKRLAAVNDELERKADIANGRANGNKWRIESLEKDLANAQKQIQALLQANDELILHLPDSDNIQNATDQKEEDTRQRVIELIKSGVPYRKIADLTGWSKTSVGNLKKELEESGDLKIVPIKQTA